jgi:tRNA-binding protein
MSAPKPPISFEQFAAVDLRVGRVTAVEDLPGARRPAYRISVDFGPLGTRHTSAQVTQYAPAELVGRLVVGAVNLGPKRVAGFVSEFLLLGALDGQDRAWLLSADAAARPGQPVA